MPSAEYRDVVVETDPELAMEFLTTWHGALPEDTGPVTLFSLPSRAAEHLPLRVLLDRIEAHGLNGLVYPTNQTRVQNVYHANALLGTVPERGRGRGKDIAASPGFWLDLDVKEKAFDSQDAIRSFVWGPMESAGLKPSILVNSGTGCHAYWITDSPCSQEEMRELGTRIWLWTQNAAGVKLDNLSDPPRVFRLPGTVWWGKGEGGVLAGKQVTTQWANPALVMPKERLRGLTEGPWKALRDRQKKAWLERKQADEEAEKRWQETRRSYRGTTSLGDLAMIQRARDAYPKMVSWDDIFEGTGWTKYGVPDEEDRQMWTRPHEPGEKVNPRSLITNWEGSPHVASLLSDNAGVLSKLRDDGVNLTKLAVSAALHFGGSEMAAVLAFMEDEREHGHGF